MAVADAIADIVQCVDLAKTEAAHFSGTLSSILTGQVGAPTEDDYGKLKRAALDVEGGWRRNLAAAVVAIRDDLMVHVLEDLARELNRADVPPGSDARTVLLALREWMIANSKVFESRAVTHNAASSITSPNTSGATGTLILHTTDDQATPDTLEAITADTLKFECSADRGAGRASGNELFRVFASVGQPARDIFENGAFKGETTLEAVCADNCVGILNGGFEQAFTSGTTDKIPGWTFSAGWAGVAANAVTVYRGAQSCAVTAAFLLKQNYQALGNDKPVYMGLRLNRSVGSAAGTLKIRLGGKSTTSGALSGLSSGWQRLEMVHWPARFSGGGFDAEIELDTTDEAISGTLYLDDVVVQPLTRIGGRYFLILAGNVDFALGDYITQASSITGTGLNIEWLHRWYGLDFELPNDATASSGWEDPS